MIARRPTRSPVLGRLALGWMLLTATAGCDGPAPDRRAVRGSVTLDGRPLSAGAILFAPTGNTAGPKAAGPIKDGRFALAADEGPVVGAQSVEIWPASAEPAEPSTDSRGADYHAAAAAPEVNQRAGKAVNGESATPEELPARYNVQTTLSVEVRAAGSNEFRFDLNTQPTP